MEASEILVGMAWVAVLAVVAGIGFIERRKFPLGRTPLPFLGMVQRQGLTIDEVGAVLSPQEMGAAVRACIGCPGRSACGAQAGPCPNEALLRRVRVAVGAA
jgi:hypothetical protein